MSSLRWFSVNASHSETGTQRNCPVRTSCCRNPFVVDIKTLPHTPQLIYRRCFICQGIWLATASEYSEIPYRPQSWPGCSHRSFGDGRFQIQNIVLGFKPNVVEDRQNRSAADDIADLLQMRQQCLFFNGAFHFLKLLLLFFEIKHFVRTPKQSDRRLNGQREKRRSNKAYITFYQQKNWGTGCMENNGCLFYCGQLIPIRSVYRTQHISFHGPGTFNQRRGDSLAL